MYYVLRRFITSRLQLNVYKGDLLMEKKIPEFRKANEDYLTGNVNVYSYK